MWPCIKPFGWTQPLKFGPAPLHCLPCALGYTRVSRGAKARADFCGTARGAEGGSHLLCNLLGVASLPPPPPPPSVRYCCAPALLAAAHIAWPQGHNEPLAVRLYGPPLRPAEASLDQREAPRREHWCRLRTDPSARLSRPHLAPSPRSGVVRKCLAGAHRGGSLGGGGGGNSSGRGPRGGAR